MRGPAPYRAGVERVGEDLGTDARWIAGCRRQVQPPPSDPAVSHLYWASAKKVAMLLRFSRSINAATQNGLANSPCKPYLEGSAPPGADALGARWAHIAAECGYFDQSHFIHEFRAFAGATPSEFLRGIATP